MTRMNPLARAAFLALALTLALGGCEDDITGLPAGSAVFEIEVSGEIFRAAVTDTAEIRRMGDRLLSGERGVVSGQLRAGHGGFNQPWGWHWEAGSVHVADMAIEVCDGRPSMVDEDLDYWIGTVKQFCPWGAKVVARRQ